MDRLLELLRAYASPNVFNPWSEGDAMDAPPHGSTSRGERLLAHFRCQPKLMLIGEAPSYQGCHYSGVAFTNEKLIMAGAIPRLSSPSRLTTRPLPWSEPSATIVWSTLRELGLAEETVLWNAFAWHPHNPGDLHSNRTPTRKEVDAGLPALRAVISHFDGVPIIPVGQVSATTLQRLGISCLPFLRHPAFGGATKFRDGLRQLIRDGTLHRPK